MRLTLSICVALVQPAKIAASGVPAEAQPTAVDTHAEKSFPIEDFQIVWPVLLHQLHHRPVATIVPCARQKLPTGAARRW
jgi:hypothetical protein